MGESFLGIPNRFRIIGRQSGGDLAAMLEDSKTYNPNHVLSAYYGYRLSTEYVNRSGGPAYGMTGEFVTHELTPIQTGIYDVGSSTNKYRYMYATTFNGNATSASKLENARNIKIDGAVQGNANFDGSGNITITTTENHDHFEFLKLDGTRKMTGNLQTTNVIPVTSGVYTVGTSTAKYAAMHASTFYGGLDGNATSASRWQTPRTLTISLANSTDTKQNSGSKSFDGSGNIDITVSAPYLPINGGTVSGNFGVTGYMATNSNIYMQGAMINNKAAGSYVEIKRNGTPAGLPSGSDTIDAYIDDIACNALVASCIVDPSVANNKPTIRILAEEVNIQQVLSALYNRDNRIACYSTSDTIWGTLNVGDIYTKGGGCIHASGDIDMTESGTLYTRNIFTYNGDDRKYIYSNGIFGFQGFGKNAAGTAGTEDYRTNIKIDPGTQENTGKITVNGSTVHGSDIRIKSNIEAISRKTSTDIISKLIPTSYDLSINDRHRGLIAQQVKLTLKEYSCDDQVCGYVSMEENSNIQQMTVDYIALIADIINTCQYLLTKVDALEVKCGVKDKLEFPNLTKENTFDEEYYREHAEEIANM